ncbi:MAG: fatty acid desaturase [Gammaproteobacteria bacterium]|nr:fatty acid desaturase [Gammaproteobacteria bacterium]
MTSGLITMPWWGYFLVTLGLTHITIASVTLYLHRCQAHRSIELHPLVSHFFRFWLWLTTGMQTREWVAIHRKHHARVETDEDPHSPQTRGISKVLWEGAELYREERKNRQTMEDYGHYTPDDWIERKVYTPLIDYGIFVMLLIDVLLFGVVGISIWAVQMIWIPFFAAGVINGFGHWWGYRNFDTPDAATNIVPIGILIGGEEMHNNHHAFAASARFSNKWWEFDVGWLYIRLLQSLGFARVKKTAPAPKIIPAKDSIDLETVSAVITNRLYVMSDYTRNVIKRVYKEEYAQAARSSRRALRKLKRAINKPQFHLDRESRHHLESLLHQNETMKIVYEFRQNLQTLWQSGTASQEALLKDLQDWCQQAEESGIEALEEFVQVLRGYSMQPALPAPR